MSESNAMALADNAMGAVDWDALHERSRAIFDAVHRGSSLALQSGLYGTPPKPTLGALMEDPHERAAYRQAGRQVGPPERGTDADIAQAAMMVAPAPMRAIMSAPKIATAGLAAYGYLSGTDTAGGAENQQATRGADPQSIKDLQIKLKDAGLYRGEVDGIMRPGGPTEQALKQFQEREAAGRAEELKRQELQTQQGANAATLATAQANEKTAAAKLEADRLKAEKDERDLLRKQAGDERVKEIEGSISPMSKAIRDYSGPIGYAAGAAMGALGRYGVTSANKYFSKAAAAEGDAIMAREIAAPAANLKGAARTTAQDATNLQRVARANEFWRKGGGEVPFTVEAGKAPGFAANPNVTPLAKTYNPNVHLAVEGTATALPAAELTVAHFNEKAANEELKSAMEAAADDASEINIQRVQKAKDNVAIWEGLSNFGRVWGGSQLLGAVGSRFTKPGPGMQPNMAPAEAEQLSLQKALRDAQAKLDAAAKKAGKKTPSVLEQRSMELGVGPTPPAFTGSAATRARQVY